jgi:hypothetical protein
MMPVTYFTVEKNFLPAARGADRRCWGINAQFLTALPNAAATRSSSIDKNYMAAAGRRFRRALLTALLVPAHDQDSIEH